MGGTNQAEQQMLDETLGTFRGDLSVLPDVQTGQNLIEGWLDALRGDGNVQVVQEKLTELQSLLQSDQPDRDAIRDVLGTLSTEAKRHAEAPTSEGTWTGKLESLSILLNNVANLL